MKKKILNKSKIKKIDTVHNSIDNLFNEKKILTNFKLTLPDEEIIENKNDNPIFREIKEQNIINNNENLNKNTPNAVEKDINKDEMHIIGERNSSDLLRAMEMLDNPDNLESNTILNNPQVIAMSVINYLAQAFDISFFKAFVKTFPRYRISGDEGRGRKEKIEIANAIRRDQQEDHQRFLESLGRR